jgi:Ydr279p protein family (RNase H2 complex component) wHTH domain
MPAKQIILIVQKPGGETGLLRETSLELITLPHPKGIPVVYIQIGGEILELQSMQPKKHGSWFINQVVSSSSNFYTASKLDPRFLCLPFLEKAGTRFCPLDQIITTSDIVGCSRLPLSNWSTWNLYEVADIKDLGDLVLFRFNESKTMDWLSGKVKRTATHFMKLRLLQSSAQNFAFVSSFQSSGQATISDKSGSAAPPSEPDFSDVKTAVQVIADYLSDAMTEKLLKIFGLSSADCFDSKSQSVKRKSDWEADLEVIKYTSSLSKLFNCYFYLLKCPTVSLKSDLSVHCVAIISIAIHIFLRSNKRLRGMLWLLRHRQPVKLLNRQQ